MKIWAILMLPLVCMGVEFDSVFENAALMSPLLQAKHEKILSSHESLKGEVVYKNPVISIGANDLLLNRDFLHRDIEPMQTHFIGITQEFETFGKLELKEAMLRVDTLILEYELEDLKVELYKKLALVLQRVETFSKILEFLEQKKRNLELLAGYYDASISIENGLKKSVALQKKIFLIEDKILELQEKIQKSKEEFYYLANQEYVPMQKAHVKSGFVLEDIKRTPKYKIFELRSRRMEIEVKLQEKKKYSNINLSLSYNHRQDFDDYLFVAASFALPIYGSEDAKARQSRYLQQESIQNGHEYLKKASMLFQNTGTRVAFLGKRVQNMNELILKYTDLRSYEDVNINNSVTFETNIENENLLLDLYIDRLNYDLEIQSARLELFYLTTERI